MAHDPTDQQVEAVVNDGSGETAFNDGSEDQSGRPHHEFFARLGSLACRWISDVSAGTLTDGGKFPSFLLTCPPGPPSPSEADTRGHDLCVIDQHSKLPEKTPGDFIIACWCKQCRHHVVFRVFASGNMCDGDPELMHHLVCTCLTPSAELEHSKYYPLLSKSEFRCSASTCTLRIVVEVSEPRLPVKFVGGLADREHTRERLIELKDRDPGRFREFLDNEARMKKLTPATYLTQYVGDIIDPIEFKEIQDGDQIIRIPVPVTQLPAQRKISLRNKIFQICFSGQFEGIFELLEFEPGEEAGDSFYYIPQLPLPSKSKTEVGSRRSFFEAVRIEVSALCNASHFRRVAWLDLDFTRPTRPRPILEQLLYPTGTYPRSFGSNLSDDVTIFATLGVTPDVHEKLLIFACICQGQTSPESREEVFRALQQISEGRTHVSDEFRQFLDTESMSLAVAQSLQDIPRNGPYHYFDVPSTSDDSTIIDAYHNKCAVSASGVSTLDEQGRNAELVKHRNNLIKIGRERPSDEISLVALTMSYSDAVDYLGMGEDVEYIYNVADTLVKDAGKDRDLIVQALRTMAQNKDDNGKVMLYGKARDIMGESRALALPQSSHTVVDTEVPQDGPVDMEKPVGLVNIRNTCYLNSILQYFFTVKIVRDVVLNWDDYKLDLTDENLKSRRLAGSASGLDRGEAFLSQKFIEEIKELFQELLTSSTTAVKPKQRLALAALKTADKLADAGSKKLITAPTPEPDRALLDKELPPPPPLPARPSPAPPTLPKRNGDDGPTVTVNAVSEHADTASNVSSQTLVNQADEDVEQTSVDAAFKPTEDEAGGAPITPSEGQKEENKLPSEKSSTLSEINSEDLSDIEDVPELENTVTKDVEMVDLTEAEASIEEKIEKALNDVSTTGTDQEDVEEVMGNILQHLSAAIKPTGTDSTTGAQTDAITDVFYWTGVKMLRKIGAAGEPTEDFKRIYDLSRWMTAFPTKKDPDSPDIDLYEALDTSFDQEFQDDGIEQFSSIVDPPKILHVYIQRSQDARTKNLEHIDIPSVLYLDRYMDSPEGSELYNKRLRSWELKRRLYSAALLEPESKDPKEDDSISKDWVVVEKFADTGFADSGSGKIIGTSVDTGASIISDRLRDSMESKSIDIDTTTETGDDDVEMVGPVSSSEHQLDHEAAGKVEVERKANEVQNRQELETLFSDMKDYPYRLHAVICHGSAKLGFGHYWVWIYDFEQDVWRQYNDTRVLVEKDPKVVLEKLSQSSDPYYLSYVREQDIDQLVNIPRRVLQEAGIEAAAPPQTDIEMRDIPSVEHVEEGDPPPYSA